MKMDGLDERHSGKIIIIKEEFVIKHFFVFPQRILLKIMSDFTIHEQNSVGKIKDFWRENIGKKNNNRSIIGQECNNWESFNDIMKTRLQSPWMTLLFSALQLSMNESAYLCKGILTTRN